MRRLQKTIQEIGWSREASGSFILFQSMREMKCNGHANVSTGTETSSAA